MARLWVVYREGLRLLGHVVANVPLEHTVLQIDIAPWRFFTDQTPDEAPAEQVNREAVLRRVLLEVRAEDRADFCNLAPGFYESPYSPGEVARRLELDVT